MHISTYGYLNKIIKVIYLNLRKVIEKEWRFGCIKYLVSLKDKYLPN